MRGLRAIAGAAAASLLTASAALAQAPTEGGYGGLGGQVQGDVEGAGALPFTGLDIALVIFAGVLLLALGVGLRRLNRAKS